MFGEKRASASSCCACAGRACLGPCLVLFTQALCELQLLLTWKHGNMLPAPAPAPKPYMALLNILDLERLNARAFQELRKADVGAGAPNRATSHKTAQP